MSLPLPLPSPFASEPHLCPLLSQDPFKLDTKLHSELANVSRVWPSISRKSRRSELRQRSVASRSSLGSVSHLRRGSAASSNAEKPDALGALPPTQAGRPVHKLDTVYSEALSDRPSGALNNHA